MLNGTALTTRNQLNDGLLVFFDGRQPSFLIGKCGSIYLWHGVMSAHKTLLMCRWHWADTEVKGEVHTWRGKTNTPTKCLTSTFLIILSLLFFEVELFR
jgi:hypothetical protein